MGRARSLSELSTLAVIGAGRIGQAIIKSVRRCANNLRVVATARRDETLRAARALGVEVSRDNNYAVREADLVILSVKPHHFPIVVKQVEPTAWRGRVVASVMAGVRLRTLSEFLRGADVYRAMPNINVLVGMSTTAIALKDGMGESASLVEELFKCLGSVYWMPEEYIDIWTSIAGSSPAFLAEIIDAMVLGAVAAGMNRDLAYRAILDVLEGTAKLLKEVPHHPARMRDEVTTPAGTTIRGLMVLESEGVKAALMKTIETSSRRSAEIGELIDRKVREALTP